MHVPEDVGEVDHKDVNALTSVDSGAVIVAAGLGAWRTREGLPMARSPFTPPVPDVYVVKTSKTNMKSFKPPMLAIEIVKPARTHMKSIKPPPMCRQPMQSSSISLRPLRPPTMITEPGELLALCV